MKILNYLMNIIVASIVSLASLFGLSSIATKAHAGDRDVVSRSGGKSGRIKDGNMNVGDSGSLARMSGDATSRDWSQKKSSNSGVEVGDGFVSYDLEGVRPGETVNSRKGVDLGRVAAAAKDVLKHNPKALEPVSASTYAVGGAINIGGRKAKSNELQIMYVEDSFE